MNGKSTFECLEESTFSFSQEIHTVDGKEGAKKKGAFIGKKPIYVLNKLKYFKIRRSRN